MPLPASGNITLAQIQAEFGAPTGTPLAEFLKGGRFVNSNVAADIPTVLPLRMSDFYGAFRPPVLEILSGSATVTGDGSLASASVADNLGVFGVRHVDNFATAPDQSNVSAECTLTVPVRVITATTPTLLLTCAEFNGLTGGNLKSYVDVNPPPYDNLSQSDDPKGPAAADTQDSYQGSWQVRMLQIPTVTSATRTSGATELPPVSDGSSVNLTFDLSHIFKARIGNQSNFGQILTFDMGIATFVRFRVALVFVSGASVVQETVLDFLIYHFGRQRAQCVEFG